MKKAILIGIFLLLCSISAWAETMYVSDVLRITLRSGPGIDHKIIKMLNSGQELEVLEHGEEWMKIQLSSGIEGWVLKRFVTPEKTSRLVLEKLGKKHEKLLSQFSTLQTENAELKDENKRLTSELENTKKSLSETGSSYESLKKNSADFLKLESDYKKATQKLNEQTKKNQKLEKNNIQNYIKAGLCGAGVLLMGFIIGFATKSNRRRSSLL